MDKKAIKTNFEKDFLEKVNKNLKNDIILIIKKPTSETSWLFSNFNIYCD